MSPEWYDSTLAEIDEGYTKLDRFVARVIWTVLAVWAGILLALLCLAGYGIWRLLH